MSRLSWKDALAFLTRPRANRAIEVAGKLDDWADEMEHHDSEGPSANKLRRYAMELRNER